MKKTLCFFAVVLLSRTCCPAQGHQAQLEAIIRDADVPGIQLVYTRNGQAHAYNAGVIKEGSARKVNSGTIFQAASLSKSVFAYAVLRLCDRGIINLDTPLLHYIGRYERFPSQDGGYARITARMCLRHTTGLPNWGNDSSVSLLFPPDSCWNYSGEGYWFLQTVIEKKLNKPLNDIMQEEVFLPLGMENSSYVWNERFDSVAAEGGPESEKGRRYTKANVAYSLLTDANDYTIFLQALSAGRGLKPATRQILFEKASPADRYGKAIQDADPYIDWGLGMGLQHNEKGKSAWHWGDNGDFKCFYMAYPDSKETLVYFTHDRKGLNIATDVLKEFFGPQTCWAIKWLGYGYESPLSMKIFRAELAKRGYDHAAEVAAEEKKKDTAFHLTENDLNGFGYLLMAKKKTEDALEIFKLNTSFYPESYNVYDSEAEAYEAVGDKALAIKFYRRSLELNPKNANATEHLKKLE
jgi:CubicO group peptidase (beta-lactamase class C family)